MNILPKKRWHVRTKDNIARVRRDEAKAAAEEKAIQQRAQLAEQEARTNFLRQQAALTRGPSETTEENSTEVSKEVTIFTADKHINLFNEVEAGQKSWGENKEREAEKKEEQEKYEKNIGYLTYLGQTTLDEKGNIPWYEKPHTKRFSDDKESKEEEVGKKTKTILDPINKLNKYLELCGKKPEKEVAASFKKLTDSTKGLVEKSLKLNSKESKSHRKRKSKKKRKHKRRDNNTSDSSEDDEEREKKQKLETLRAERLRREAEERKKSEKLLTKLKNPEEDSEKPKQVPEKDGDQGYNSQFNPHLAKKPKIY